MRVLFHLQPPPQMIRNPYRLEKSNALLFLRPSVSSRRMSKAEHKHLGTMQRERKQYYLQFPSYNCQQWMSDYKGRKARSSLVEQICEMYSVTAAAVRESRVLLPVAKI